MFDLFDPYFGFPRRVRFNYKVPGPKTMGWRERVIEEREELSIRCASLSKFLDTPIAIADVSKIHLDLLTIQLDTMVAYKRILTVRLGLSGVTQYDATEPIREGDITDYVRPTPDPEHL